MHSFISHDPSVDRITFVSELTARQLLVTADYCRWIEEADAPQALC